MHRESDLPGEETIKDIRRGDYSRINRRTESTIEDYKNTVMKSTKPNLMK
ncbi:MAG: hypothetical protein LUF90_06790 [Rikenellaceae bacterium]|nr:hypothetical protein [Rikenellaceae bacterium]